MFPTHQQLWNTDSHFYKLRAVIPKGPFLCLDGANCCYGILRRGGRLGVKGILLVQYLRNLRISFVAVDSIADYAGFTCG